MKALFLFLIFLLPISAQDFDPFGLPSGIGAPAKTESRAKLVSDVQAIAPGESFTVALQLAHPEGWHSYYINTGLMGEPLVPEWTLPEGFTADYLGWPTPHLSNSFGFQTIGYEGTVTHLFQITPPSTLALGEEVSLALSASWQICDNSGCILENFSGTLRFDITAEGLANPATADLFIEARSHYPKPADGLEMSASESEDFITLTISNVDSLNAEKLKFFDEHGQVSVQDPQKAQREGDVIVMQLKRNLGTDMTDAGPVREVLSGILTDGENSFTVATSLVGAVAKEAEVPVEGETVVRENTPEEIAAMAKLYDSSKKIDFVTLGEKAETTLLTALFGAFVGGILLNLMPCVFPVLGLKVMGFVEQAGNDAKKIRLHGLAFTAGLVAAMWVLAGVILFLKLSLGREVNWGQQMGNPYFVGAIIILLFVLGLNMAGVFEMGTSLTSAGQKVKKKGYTGSFFSGILTTLIATPCSGPFLGAAMGYTLAQSAGVALFLFTIFALGIALPYLLLSFFPALINKLPRPGAWMETFKVTMSFALFATVAFFMKTFGNQTGVNGLSLLVMSLVILGLALYFFGRWTLPHLKKSKRLWQGKVLPLAIASGSLLLAVQAMQSDAPKIALAHGWESWHPGKVEQSRSKKRIVWVDYTADW